MNLDYLTRLLEILKKIKFIISITSMCYEKPNNGIRVIVRQIWLLNVYVLIMIGVNFELILCAKLLFPKLLFL